MALFTGLAVCSGAGMLEHAVAGALDGHYRCVCHLERDAFAAAVLVARMEDASLDPAPIWSDARSFDGRPWRGKVDLITAGFPCQPHSTAGQKKHTADERWIWPDIARIVREVGPSVVFLENVPGLVLGGLDVVLSDLHLCGFDAEWDVFSAEEVGAPHQRERLFVLAWDVSDPDRAILRLAAKNGICADKPSAGTPSLESWAKSWPTPCARDHKGPFSEHRKGGRDLADTASKWMTPIASDEKRGRRANVKTGESLTFQARSWPTPTSSDVKGSRRHGYMKDGHPGTTLLDRALDHAGLGPPDPTTPTAGRATSPSAVLNPRFVEALMGWPDNWTALLEPTASAPSVTASSRRSKPKKRSGRSPPALSKADEKPLPFARVHACGYYEIGCGRRTKTMRRFCRRCLLWFSGACHKCAKCRECEDVRGKS